MHKIFNLAGKSTFTLDPNSASAQIFKNSGAKKIKFSTPKIAKAVKPSLDAIYIRGQDAISQSFPEGDPIDYLSPYLRVNGLTFEDVNKAFNKNEKKDFNSYLAKMWDDSALDAISDAKYKVIGESSPFYTIEENKTITVKNNPWK